MTNASSVLNLQFKCQNVHSEIMGNSNLGGGGGGFPFSQNFWFKDVAY